MTVLSTARRAMLGLALALGMSAAAHAAGPTSVLYLDTENEAEIYAIQGASIINMVHAGPCIHCESALAVTTDIRSVGNFGGFGEYGSLYGLDLSHSPSAPKYFNPFPAQQQILEDGASDGRRFFSTSAVYDAASDAYGPQTVYAFDKNWANPTVLFTVADNLTLDGITYDPVNGSMWLAETVDESSPSPTYLIADYALDGTLLSSFSSLGEHGLAMDYKDGTLWSIRGAGSSLDQYSTSGALLQQVTYNDLDGGLSTAGIEFAIVPEPSAWALMLAGFAGLGAALRTARRRTAAA